MDKLQLLIILSIVSLVNSQFAFFLLDDGKNYNQTWQDQNCIPPTSVTFYKIIDIDGYYRIGDFVQPNYDKIGTFEGWQKPYGPAIAIRQYEENGQHMIIQLGDVEKVWDSVTANYKADTNITIWRPISPDSDYVVMGDIATQGYNVKPDMSSLVAVHKSCVTTCQLGPLLWSSYTSLNADVYGLESPSHDGLLGTFFTVVSQDGFDGETSSTYPCLKMSCLNDNVPQQVHLAASTDISTFRISWSTKSLTKSLLTYGTDPSSLGHTVQGSSYKYTDLGLLRLSQYFHQVKVTGLSPNTTYYYRVGDPLHGWSRTYAFTTLPLVTEELHCLVYGDLGYDNSRSLSLLKAEVTTGDYNFILHVGDFAYDMSDNNGLRGDNFMRMIEPLSASVPYHVCPGNHENAYNFSQYIHRFDNMPTEECGTNTPLYYSWDAGLVHFLSFSTEAYFTNPMEWGYIESQYNFLEADLIKANENRNKRPWIIMMGHRPLYCTDDSVTGIEEYTDCTIDAEILRVGPQGKYGIEQLFKKYGVDIYFTAHEHSYERLFPIYDGIVYGESYVNPKAPVHIIGGAAGNQEDLDGFGEKAPWDAFRSSSYGYGRLLVKNSTHLYWEQVGDINGQVIDSFVLIQENHGPFKF